MIDDKKIRKVKSKIARLFPGFKGIEPEVREKTIKPQSALYEKLAMGAPKQIRQIYKLKFKKKIETVDQIKIERILTVTLDERGKVIKITESK